MDQQRVLLFFLISAGLLLLYQSLVLDRYRHEPSPTEQVARRPATTEPTAPTARPEESASEAPEIPAAPLLAPRGEGAEVVIETDVLRAVITPVGARLARLDLRDYRRGVEADSGPLDLVHDGPLLPLTVQLDDTSSDAALAYRPDAESLVLHGETRGSVVFTAESPAGVIEKRFEFTGNGYLFDLSVRGAVARAGTLGLVVTPMLAEGVPVSRGCAGAGYARQENAMALGAKLVRSPLASQAKEPVPVPDAHWAGFANQYFLVAVLSAAGPAPALLTMAELGPAQRLPIVRVDAPVADGEARFAVYAGPKDREALARAGHDLGRALDFGWFWFVALPLLRLLELLHRVTGNYGVSIIVLTALLKLAMLPLTQSSFRNMREMQRLQPQMAKLRERFKDDPTALQKEVMDLYRRHRVNPFAGCLTMAPQFPIFIGLYNALLYAIELRHAPFFLWINDLSAADRLMIAGVPVPLLTLLMGASMFLQQWITPAQGDPAQQKMMMFMPVVFTIMFVFGNFPSGLVLYWLVNNVITIAQQYWVIGRTAPRPTPAR